MRGCMPYLLGEADQVSVGAAHGYHFGSQSMQGLHSVPPDPWRGAPGEQMAQHIWVKAED